MVNSGTPDERKVRDVINNAKSFKWNGQNYQVIECAKPTADKGEPKTDTYIKAKNVSTKKIIEIKISTKKRDWAAVENKVTAKRARYIYGEKFIEIVAAQNNELKEIFSSLPLIYFQKKRGNERGTITLGWRYEIMYESAKDKPDGKRRPPRKTGLWIKEEIYPQIYWGKGCAPRHMDAKVNGKIVKNSGIPDWMLIKNKDEIENTDDIFSDLEPIKEFGKKHKELDLTYLKQNYRTELRKECDCGTNYRWILDKCPNCSSKKRKNKASVAIQGMKRELPVWTKWEVVKGKLRGTVVVSTPFKKTSGEVLKNLQDCLTEIRVPDDNSFSIDSLEGKISEDTQCTE